MLASIMAFAQATGKVCRTDIPALWPRHAVVTAMERLTAQGILTRIRPATQGRYSVPAVYRLTDPAMPFCAHCGPRCRYGVDHRMRPCPHCRQITGHRQSHTCQR